MRESVVHIACHNGTDVCCDDVCNARQFAPESHDERSKGSQFHAPTTQADDAAEPRARLPRRAARRSAIGESMAEFLSSANAFSGTSRVMAKTRKERAEANAQEFAGLRGRVAVITGGYGVLGGAIASGLAQSGVRVAVLGRREDAAAEKAAAIRNEGGEALPLVADVLDAGRLRQARTRLLEEWGQIDIAVNAAGGNVARARSDDRSVFEVPMEAFDEVLRLNLHGTVLPSLVFGETMAGQGSGCIVNVSSMASTRAISGVAGYSAAKGAVESFTRWLAVDLARKHNGRVRVNAIAPGFFVTEQNRTVLLNPDGSYTDRARQIVYQTPMGRFGDPAELVGAVRWLCSDAASFGTGVVIPVDGGFAIASGV